MYKILKKQELNPSVTLMEIEAEYIAPKVKPGQFIILRVDEAGERIPLTVADWDVKKRSITIIFQMVGKTTKKLGAMRQGDSILDVVGPLGQASHFDGVKKAAVVGGGLGSAIAYPSAKALAGNGADVDVIAGFRTKELILLEDEFKAVATRAFIATDDGSNGNKGFVTDVLKSLIEEGNSYDMVLAIGPLPMMRALSNLTREYGIKTVVSMNPIMIDGTGMCGGCRLTVGGQTKFACVDGPEFDGHLVDFDSAMKRSVMFKEHEILSDHMCRLGGANG